VSHDSEGRWLRQRRRSAGVSQSQLGHVIGVRASLIGAWERDEVRPTVAQARALGSALGLSPDDTDRLVALGTPTPVASLPPSGGTIIMGERMVVNGHRTSQAPDEAADPAPTLELVADSGDPWTDQLEPGIDAPLRVLREGARPPDLTALRRSAARIDQAELQRRRRSLERDRRRTADRERRAAVRREIERRRAEARAEYREQVERARAEARLRDTDRFGTVFPVPDPTGEVERYVYGAGHVAAAPADRMVYVSRWLRVALVLLVMVVVLAWALGELGDGWNAFLDLFGEGQGAVDGVVDGQLFLTP
jgi:transcriptional regulator with XRE-family HTH domain